jgi:HAD superfamily hydrolase (TIGR01549 family)
VLRGVLFDYGETLVRFVRPRDALAEADERIAALLARSGMLATPAGRLRSTVLDRVEDEVIEHQASGELTEMDVVAASRRAYLDAGLDLDAGMLDEVLRIEQEAWWHGARVDAAAVPLLESLRGEGIRVGLCSNAPYRIRSLHEQLDFVGLAGHLDAVTFSAEVGWRKPSPRIFEAALLAIGTEPARSLMVGDSEVHDIAGAHGVGMRAVLLDRAGTHRSSEADAVIGTLEELTGAARDIGIY